MAVRSLRLINPIPQFQRNSIITKLIGFDSFGILLEEK